MNENANKTFTINDMLNIQWSIVEWLVNNTWDNERLTEMYCPLCNEKGLRYFSVTTTHEELAGVECWSNRCNFKSNWLPKTGNYKRGGDKVGQTRT